MPALDALRRYSLQQIYLTKKSTHLGTARVQQFSERPKPLPSQVPQLLAMGLFHWRIEPGQRLEPFRSDPGHYHSPVLGFPAARNQLPLFQAVEQPGNVRIPRNHAAGNLAAKEPFGRA